ncbi:MAG: branched-chain amino acid ABC transporter substrate-binding protein [Actinomycetota bacterium]|nr:branched-chain amino acid ABC transporter substrate-binding protein [Actinomycetota bacterium]
MKADVTGGGTVKRRFWWGGVAAVAAALALVAAGCGGGDDEGGNGGGQAAGGNAEALPSASCGPVRFGKNGTPDFIVASDLPLQGAGRAQTLQMTKAIEFVFKQRGWKAGDHFVGYQSCDDSTAQAGGWDSARCSSNARSYANNESVIGVIGTFNSGCAKLVIPVLNRAQDGPVAMISPANTYPGLTVGGAGTESGEPDVYYPSGKRNYARVVWTDAFQGAADALLAQQLGLKSVYVVNDAQTYGIGLAKLFRRAAQKLGIKIAGFQKWDAKATSYESLGRRISASGADGVFISGIVCNNGGKLVKDIRAAVGRDVTLIGPDGFTPFSAVIQGAGQAAENMYISAPGIPTEELKGTGARFVREFGQEVGDVDPYSAYAAQAAEIVLDAIAASDGTRGDVADRITDRSVNNSILGTFRLDENGDTTLGTVTINQIKGGSTRIVRTITPKVSFVKG